MFRVAACQLTPASNSEARKLAKLPALESV